MTVAETIVACTAIICGTTVFALIICRGSGPPPHLPPPPRRETLMRWTVKPGSRTDEEDNA